MKKDFWKRKMLVAASAVTVDQTFWFSSGVSFFEERWHICRTDLEAGATWAEFPKRHPYIVVCVCVCVSPSVKTSYYKELQFYLKEKELCWFFHDVLDYFILFLTFPLYIHQHSSFSVRKAGLTGM